jgi:hypothetical protein
MFYGKMKIAVDLRLFDVSLEICLLEEYLELLERQIDQISKSERLRLDAHIEKERISPDEPEWHSAMQDYHHRVDFVLPRLFRGPFLAPLYAVYESGVTEIARLIQEKQKQPISLDDLKGDFLERAIKYYKHLLNFPLCADDKAWQRIKVLAVLRNAMAHANGRIEMLNYKAMENVRSYERRGIGVSIHSGYVVFDRRFLEETFALTRTALDDIVERYKRWDSGGNSV